MSERSLKKSFADPRLTDYELLLSNLKDLRQGKTTKVCTNLHTDKISVFQTFHQQ